MPECTAVFRSLLARTARTLTTLPALVLPVFLASSLLPTGANAQADLRAKRLQVAPALDQLVAQAESGDRVQVIAHLAMHPRGKGPLLGIRGALTNLRDYMGAHGLADRGRFRKLPLAVYEVDAAQLQALVDSGLVVQVVEDRLNRPSLVESRALISASASHDVGFDGAGATVAVIDTGIDTSHPVFAGRIVEEACFSTHAPGSGFNSLCPGGSSTQYGAGSSEACTGFSACNHGTHVTSTAAGSDTVVTGIAPAANIISIQGFLRYDNEDYCGTPSCIVARDSDLIKALEYVESLSSSYDIAAVNLSLGGGKRTSPCDSEFSNYKAAIDLLRASGILTIIASGNNGYTDGVNIPGCVSTAVTVGSVDDTTDTVSSFSNSASLVDVLAPGKVITAAVPASGYGDKQGTSMATPHVAGAAAIAKGVWPEATADELEALVLGAAQTVVDSRNSLSFPRIDLAQMANTLSQADGVPQITITSPVDGTSTTTASTTLAATATDREDGDLSASLAWTSSIDGTLTSPATLSVGTHQITATVTDSEGYTAHASVTITINSPPGC